MAPETESTAPSYAQQPPNRAGTTSSENESGTRTRSSTQSSGRLRSASLKFLESNPPSGMWHATGTVLAQAPTPLEIRRGSFGHGGWDGELQRRNSNISEESSGQLSRYSSGQTPGSLVRTKTNPLEAHPEVDDEGPSTQPRKGPEGKAFDTKDKTVTGAPNTAAPKDADDPFDMFVGRGRIVSQSFEPKSNRASVAVRDELATDGADDADSLDELDPRPKKRLSALPNKFTDPAGDSIPMPLGGEASPEQKTKPHHVERSDTAATLTQPPDADGVYPTGYKFPPKHTWGEATIIGLKAFWKFTLTPLGFCIVIYGLNVVAWGGMLFLLLIGGGKEYMCYPPNKPPGYKDCDDIDAPRRVWIEIDSQILNALFCVTGFGLIPWRFRDLYYLLQFRIRKQEKALRRLAGIHRDWFRLPGSHRLPVGSVALPDAESNSSVAWPTAKSPPPPLTGNRAPDSKLWKLDYVIWAYVVNTFLQAVLSGFMWGLNRYDRPSWSTGLFVALACIVAALGGLMAFQEGKRVKAVEGIPVTADEILHDAEKQVGKKDAVKTDSEKTHRKTLWKIRMFG